MFEHREKVGSVFGHAMPDDVAGSDELYIGRMIKELLKNGLGTVTVSTKLGHPVKILVEYDTGAWHKRSAMSKSIKELQLSQRPLNEGNYDAENLLRHHDSNGG